MICASCKSSNFEEDQQGFLYCTSCGTQNEDTFAESFENENQSQSAFSGRNIIGNYVKVERQPLEQGASGAGPHRILYVCQGILQLFTKAVIRISGVTDISRQVKELWFSYLQKWNLLGGNLMCTVLQQSAAENSNGIHDEETRAASDRSIMLLAPSRLLFLGFINMSCRLLRLWITPLDIIRWCKEGVIPYSDPLEHVSSDIKKTISPSSEIYKLFMKDFTGGESVHAVSPSNILFHTIELGNMLEMDIPPLNFPLIARSMFSSLALPYCTLPAHAKLLQYLKPNVRIKRFRYHLEDIIMSVFLACKCVPSWVEWTVSDALCGHVNSDICSTACLFDHLISSTATADSHSDIVKSKLFGSAENVSQYSLGLFLHQACSTLRSTAKATPSGKLGYCSFNKVITRFLQCHSDISLQHEHPGCCDRVGKSEHTVYSPFSDNYSENIIVPGGLEESGGVVTFSDGHHQTGSGISLSYLCFLERFARYSQASPALLSSLMDKLDNRIVDIAVDDTTLFTKSHNSNGLVDRCSYSLKDHQTISSDTVICKVCYNKRCLYAIDRLKYMDFPKFQTVPSQVLSHIDAGTGSCNNDHINAVKAPKGVSTVNKKRKRNVRKDLLTPRKKSDAGGPLLFCI